MLRPPASSYAIFYQLATKLNVSTPRPPAADNLSRLLSPGRAHNVVTAGTEC